MLAIKPVFIKISYYSADCHAGILANENIRHLHTKFSALAALTPALSQREREEVRVRTGIRFPTPSWLGLKYLGETD